MNQFFTTKVSYKKTDDKDGKVKKVTESYLINAMSVIEAEARMIEFLPNNYYECEVSSAGKSSVVDIFSHGDHPDWFLARIADPVEDDKGNIKKTFFYIMINGEDIIGAAKSIKENFRGSVMDYEINSIQCTNIIVDADLTADPDRTSTDEAPANSLIDGVTESAEVEEEVEVEEEETNPEEN